VPAIIVGRSTFAEHEDASGWFVGNRYLGITVTLGLPLPWDYFRIARQRHTFVDASISGWDHTQKLILVFYWY
jgi:hypothetical protein